ncbi:unnamed protein product, partial [Brenthis ino]
MFMICNFFANNSDFCDAEFRNVKTSLSARQSYGDDAIGYVQLRRDSDLCTIKCRVCPEHKVRSKSYSATMIVDEKGGKIVSVECHDCAASTGGCKHSVAFLMWVHRRSEEPSSTDIQCYWKKSKLSQVGTNIKCITTKDLSTVKTQQATQTTLRDDLLSKFLQEATHRGVTNLFLEENIKIIEEHTVGQHKSRLWHELRYGRVTASKAYEVSKCLTSDGSLVAVIMGAKTPDTKAMKRGRVLESKVRVTVEKKLGKKVKFPGWYT